MSDKLKYVPALGRPELTNDYDRVIAVMTRERRWRASLINLIAPDSRDVIVDIGCGTGTLAVAIKQRAPAARVIGIDPDPAILALARAKASVENVSVEWVQGLGDRAAEIVGVGRATKAVSSLVLHQCDLDVKSSILKAMRQCLAPGGGVFIADYGLQRTLLMKLLYRQVQALDGWERTGLNAKGVITQLLPEAGFQDAKEVRVIPTPTGSISIYSALSP